MATEILQKILLNQWIDSIEQPVDTTSSNNLILHTVKRILKSRRSRFAVAMYKWKKQSSLKPLPKAPSFFRTIDNYEDDVFYSHFRMRRDTLQKLCQLLEPSWIRHENRPAFSLKCSLYVTIWKLCTRSGFREISSKFSISQATAYRMFMNTIMQIGLLKNKTILFPSNERTQNKAMALFEQSCSHPFPFALGCIHGIHIRISTPTRESNKYYNRKGFYSVIVQAVVDSNMKFTDAFVGFPGRSPTVKVWRKSPLRNAILNKKIKFPTDCYLLGDGAYPLETYLMIPYRDNGLLNSKQKTFNKILDSTRVHAEQAFSILKKRFRILDRIEIQKLELSKHIIMACMVLHNVVVSNEGTCDEDMQILKSNQYTSTKQERNITKNLESTQSDEARVKRNKLADLFSN